MMLIKMMMVGNYLPEAPDIIAMEDKIPSIPPKSTDFIQMQLYEFVSLLGPEFLQRIFYLYNRFYYEHI